jgi:hypothetical protein
VSFQPLFSHLPVKSILEIFYSLLIERRVIICARRPSTVSACVTGLSALLTPLSWQVPLAC